MSKLFLTSIQAQYFIWLPNKTLRAQAYNIDIYYY